MSARHEKGVPSKVWVSRTKPAVRAACQPKFLGRVPRRFGGIMRFSNATSLFRSYGILDVVARDQTHIADVQSTVGDDGIRPRFGIAAVRLIRRSETTLFVIGFGGRLDERHVALFAV